MPFYDNSGFRGLELEFYKMLSVVRVEPNFSNVQRS